MTMRTRFWRRYQEERGSTVLIFTVMVVALLGFASMAIDTGLAYWNQRLLQNAVDAATLAGATHLPTDPDEAKSIAGVYANHNGLTNDELTAIKVTNTYNTNDTITVTATRKFDVGLRYLIGAGDLDIVASASAIVVAKQPRDLAPFGVSASTEEACAVGDECALKVGTQQSTGGNFHLLDFPDSSGASDVAQWILSGYDGEIPAPVATTTPAPGATPGPGEPVWGWVINSEPGQDLGPIKSAIHELFVWDDQQLCWDDGDNAPSCETYYKQPPDGDVELYNPTLANRSKGNVVCYDDLRCPRVVLVPFISEPWTDNGKTWVTVTSFGCFYITRDPTDLQGNEFGVYGIFVKYCNDEASRLIYDSPLDTDNLHTRTIQIILWK